MGRRHVVRLLLVVIGVLVAVAGVLSATAAALPTCTDTFIGASGGDWATAANWDHGVPTSSTVACWSAKTVVVSSGNQTADSVQGANLSITGGSLALPGSGGSSTLVNYSESGPGASLNGPGSLAVSGDFSWTGGEISNNSAIAITQRGGGAFSITGTTRPYLTGGSIDTTSNVSISNPNFIAANYNGAATLSTTGTVSFAPVSYSANGYSLPISAAGFVTTGATTAPSYSLHLTGNSSSLGGSLSVPALSTNAGSTLIVPSGVTLTSASGTVSGTVTGAGTYDQGDYLTTFAAGSTLSTHDVAMLGGTIAVDSAATYSAAGSTTITRGALNLAPTGASTGDFTESGGNLNGPGALAISGAFSWTGGEISPSSAIAITQAGGGAFSITGSSQAYLIGGSINTTSDISITNPNFIAANFTGAPTLSSSGTVSFSPGTYPPNGNTSLIISAAGFITTGATTIQSYSLHLTGNASSLGGSLSVPVLSTDAGSTLTVPSAVTLTSTSGTVSGTITGAGSYDHVGYTTTFAAGSTLSTRNVVVLADGGTLAVSSAATYSAGSTTINNNGSLQLATTGASTGDFTESGGNLNGPGALAISGAFSWTGGEISPSSAIAITQRGGGSFSIGGSDRPYLTGGSINTTSDISITNPNFITAAFNGRPTVTTTGTLSLADGLVVSANGGNSATFTAAGIASNAGPSYGFGADALVLTGGASTVVAGNTLQSGPLTLQGGTLQDDGTVQAPSETLSGGTLKGTGSLAGPLSNTGATVAPGDSPGTLTVNGDYTQGSGATLAAQITGTGAGQHSVLQVNGSVALDGTLALQPSSSYASSASTGDTLGVLPHTGSRTGTFSTVTTTPPLHDGEQFTADYTPAHTINAIVGTAAAATNTTPPAITGTATQGQTLSTTNGTWTNHPTAYAYQWQDCDSSGTGCTNIPDATHSTHTLTASDVGHTIRATITATNPGGSAPATSAPTATVTAPPAPNPPPANTTPPAITGTTVQGQTLSTTTGTWTGNPTSYANQWKRCDTDGIGCTNIADATNTTYHLAQADVGHTMRIAVTATNSGGDASATSDKTATITTSSPSSPPPGPGTGTTPPPPSSSNPGPTPPPASPSGAGPTSGPPVNRASLVGKPVVVNPLQFVAPSSTHVNPLFHHVASSLRSVEADGRGCVSASLCQDLDLLALGDCLQAVGGNADLSITGDCLKLTSRSSLRGVRNYVLTSTGPVSADGVTFTPVPGGMLRITERAGPNGAEEFAVTGGVSNQLGDVSFESVGLDSGATSWRFTQLASGGYQAGYSHGQGFQTGTAPVPPQSTFNGLVVASATMPTFHAGRAAVELTTALPPELGGATGSQPIRLTNGTLAAAMSAAPSEPLIATGANALDDAQHCHSALTAPIPTGPAAFTIPFPHISYHGVHFGLIPGIEGGGLTLAGPQHYIGKLHMVLPYPANEATYLDAVIEIYQGRLRFGCASGHFDPVATLPNTDFGLKDFNLGFVSASGSADFFGTVTMEDTNGFLHSDGTVALSLPQPGSGNPWSLHVDGDLNAAKLLDFRGSLDYSSVGYIQTSAHVDGIPLDLIAPGLTLGPLNVSGTKDPTGAWLLEGTGKVKFAGFSVASADALFSSLGLGACGKVLFASAGFTSTWSGDYHVFFGCDGLSAVRAPVWATCQQLTAELIVPILASQAQADLNAGRCANVPGSGPAARARAVHAAAAGTASLFNTVVPSGVGQLDFVFHGSGASPTVTLTGPDGHRVRTPVTGGDTGDPGSTALLDQKDSSTILVVKRPAPGVWFAQADPGSAPITTFGLASPLPPVTVSGRVRSGSRAGARQLRYRVAGAAGRTVIFFEKAAGLSHKLGRARADHGTLDFVPLPGPAGQRQIIALIQSGSAPLRRVAVTSYNAPPMTKLPRVGRISVQAVGSAALVNFVAVAGGHAYTVAVKLSDGRHYSVTIHAHRLRIPALARGLTRIAVQVNGLDWAGRSGATATLHATIRRAQPRMRLPGPSGRR